MFVVPFSQTVRARLLAVREVPWTPDSTASATNIHTFTVSLGTPYPNRNIYMVTAAYSFGLTATVPSMTLNSSLASAVVTSGTSGSKLGVYVKQNTVDTTGVIIVNNSNSTAVAYRVLYVFAAEAQSQSSVQNLVSGVNSYSFCTTTSALGGIGFGVAASSGTHSATFIAGNPPLDRYEKTLSISLTVGVRVFYWTIDHIAEVRGSLYTIDNVGQARWAFWD